MMCVNDTMFDLRDANFAKAMLPKSKQESEVDELMAADKTLRNYKLPVCPHPSTIPKLELDKGTTTLGIRVKDGIVLVVDSRASSGEFIASRTTQKVLPMGKTILGTMAGGAADCQYWERVLAQECRLWELRNKCTITVAAASKILAGISYSRRNHGLSMGTLVAGWDEFGPALYTVDDQGTRLKGDKFSQGSGSVYALGILEEHRTDMTIEEGIALGRKAVMHATHRDAYSGGFIQAYVVRKPDANGHCWERVSRDDCDALYRKAHADGTATCFRDLI